MPRFSPGNHMALYCGILRVYDVNIKKHIKNQMSSNKTLTGHSMKSWLIDKDPNSGLFQFHVQ